MAKAIMIQGTGSGAGKSAIVAGLCRIFRDMGIRVVPFKAQNMALNSFITRQGGEIGRAQAFQAEAAGLEAHNDMNPVLLKASGEAGCQVIINGTVHATMKAREYYAIREKAWEEITAAYDRLSKEYDLIVIEGAGSPAEINLRQEEVVNMRVARYAEAPVILVGDIDRGGIFAQFYGTVELLKDITDGDCHTPSPTSFSGGLSDADYIKAFIVNKFRGDMDILRPGLRMIEEKTGRPVIGTIYHQSHMGLDEEDGLAIERISRFTREDHKDIRIVVLRLRYISNFTDFGPFMYEPDVEIKYSIWEEDIRSADLLIIPGSKNTVADLLHLRESGVEDCVKAAIKQGTPLIGICGGYQMIGEKICDPYNVESALREIDGMGFLDTVTTFDRTKTTCRVEAYMRGDGQMNNLPLSIPKSCLLRGYEIHMGKTTGDIGLFEIKRVNSNTMPQPLTPNPLVDGSSKGNVWGTYIHGIFDNDEFRTGVINSLREKKGLKGRDVCVNYQAKREEAINRWADVVKNSVDICFILRQAGMEYCVKQQGSHGTSPAGG